MEDIMHDDWKIWHYVDYEYDDEGSSYHEHYVRADPAVYTTAEELTAGIRATAIGYIKEVGVTQWIKDNYGETMIGRWTIFDEIPTEYLQIHGFEVSASHSEYAGDEDDLMINLEDEFPEEVEALMDDSE